MKNSKSKEDLLPKGVLPEKQYLILQDFFSEYQKAASKSLPPDEVFLIFKTLIDLILEQVKTPYSFPPHHQKVRSPFDYYEFGLRFIRPIIDKSKCKVLGQPYAKKIVQALQNKENVIFLANHQSELDPLLIDYLLTDSFPDLGANIIHVAGERVITDPAAIPFSLGRDLLCIYSKKYIDHPPELKEKKQLHNSRTMKLMSDLLSEGGIAIYVAPSGGRDRKNAEGAVEVAPFDPQSIEMFYLMAKRAKRKTHFYPLALDTYDILPPPNAVQKELGEKRNVTFTGVRMAFGPEVDMLHFPGSDGLDRITLRKTRAEYIWNQVKKMYEELLK